MQTWKKSFTRNPVYSKYSVNVAGPCGAKTNDTTQWTTAYHLLSSRQQIRLHKTPACWETMLSTNFIKQSAKVQTFLTIGKCLPLFGSLSGEVRYSGKMSHPKIWSTKSKIC
jgi:hypothetical protein